MFDTTRKDICIHGHFDCFARSQKGVCYALTDTDFGYRDCPFYKPQEQLEKEEQAARRRNGRDGWDA